MDIAETRLGRPIRLTLGQSYEPGVLIATKYRLESRLGEGGMGTVWLARNETLEAPVALKLIRSGMQRQETVERLLLEARVEARLRHPNIVRVFDFGQTELGHAFMVMELLDGVSLGTLLCERGRLGGVEAVRLVLPVIGALCYAHEHGVVHRDLKPDNIFLDRGGLHAGTKLLDFGIAKLVGDHSFTEGGTLLGSPSYMAPEQAQGSEDVDHRADIWAMCVVLYEAISGSLAFSGDDYSVLQKVIHGEVQPLENENVATPELWKIISRGLQKDRARRFQTMGELGTALAQWLCDQGVNEDLDGNRLSSRWGVGRSVHAARNEQTEVRELTLPSFRARNRRTLVMPDPSEAPATFLHQRLRARSSKRRANTLRALAALVFIAVVLLAPSKIPSESGLSTRAEQAHPVPALQAAGVDLAVALPADRAAAEPPVTESDLIAEPTLITEPQHIRAEAPARRKPRHRETDEQTARPLTEAELGLKVPY